MALRRNIKRWGFHVKNDRVWADRRESQIDSQLPAAPSPDRPPDYRGRVKFAVEGAGASHWFFCSSDT